MLVQALAEYTDRYLGEQLNDSAWERKPVPWLLELSMQGTFLGVTSRMTQVMRGKKQVSVAMEMRVPRSPVNRNSGEHPLLGTDDIVYVLGEGAWTTDRAADREKADRHHQAFVALVDEAALETRNEALAACARFYASVAEVSKAREALREAKAGSLVALSVGGPLVDLEPVQAFWRVHYQDAFNQRMGAVLGECIISGQRTNIAPTHEPVKGLGSLGGQPKGVALMSFDKEAFQSYGWDKNGNSPVSPDRALAYVLALNDLLRPGGSSSRELEGRVHRRDIAGVGFIFWTRNPSEFDVFSSLDPPDVASVEALLKLQPVEVDANQFYMAGVSGNGGRLRVRYWITDSLNHIKTNLKEWREQLRITYPWDDPGPLRFWQLLYAIHREGKPPAHHTLALLRRAIEGNSQPLGHAVLSVVLGRMRHPAENGNNASKAVDLKGLTRLRPPMGLVRLCINDIQRVKGGSEMSEGLDPNCTVPAYICGRLMAEFENLQRACSENEVNTTVLDRYFSLASTYPAVAFPKIESLGQKHLRKLRRDKPGAAFGIESRLLELHNKLVPGEAGAYPGKLSIEGQGLFALGYYHQKAWSIAQARDRKQSNGVIANEEK